MRLARFLSADERRRAQRFVFDIDRRRYCASHALLREILGGYLSLPGAAVALGEDGQGKPRLATGPDDVRFNLSHSGSMGVVAVARGQDVGVDVEGIRSLPDLDTLAETCFTDGERAALRGLPEPERLQAFFAGWTRKEAFLKLCGEGLRRSLQSFEVSLDPVAPARLLWLAGEPDASSRYTLLTLRPAPGFAGAIAVAAAGVRVIVRSSTELTPLRLPEERCWLSETRAAVSRGARP